ncbi:MAG: peptidase [Gammaproteobacteria bacterium]|nr:peptidase [Gammaproteobacteria bacterium]
MTYCVAVKVDEGLVFVSDSRTNAGVDHISTYAKMHTFCGDGTRFFVLLSAGNLATSRAVVTHLRHDMVDGAKISLNTVKHMTEAADYIGQVSRDEQQKHGKRVRNDQFCADATFILGGQIQDETHSILMIYPEGNYIPVSRHSPFLQIGEDKYGKPILDRIIEQKLSLEVAGRCALVSMDSTMRSNASVGPPIDLLLYSAGTQRPGSQVTLGEDDEYLRALRRGWQDSLKAAFLQLPELPLPSPDARQADDD